MCSIAGDLLAVTDEKQNRGRHCVPQPSAGFFVEPTIKAVVVIGATFFGA
jgi:hypothetical protein